ncbi:hypothetical protein JOB18_020795 [Solea senegalensis]|uniref:Uncharacterized protein n=1 Tax=Solea senegalensis TaxID=28829 RepID=A0AAV6P9T0_SOLSE|nr:hypothetical protein JOB18_020795 [Solea senegalensis]
MLTVPHINIDTRPPRAALRRYSLVCRYVTDHSITPAEFSLSRTAEDRSQIRPQGALQSDGEDEVDASAAVTAVGARQSQIKFLKTERRCVRSDATGHTCGKKLPQIVDRVLGSVFRIPQSSFIHSKTLIAWMSVLISLQEPDWTSVQNHPIRPFFLTGTELKYQSPFCKILTTKAQKKHKIKWGKYTVMQRRPNITTLTALKSNKEAAGSCVISKDHTVILCQPAVRAVITLSALADLSINTSAVCAQEISASQAAARTECRVSSVHGRRKTRLKKKKCDPCDNSEITRDVDKSAATQQLSRFVTRGKII